MLPYAELSLPLNVPIAAAELKAVERVGFKTGLVKSRGNEWVRQGVGYSAAWPHGLRGDMQQAHLPVARQPTVEMSEPVTAVQKNELVNEGTRRAIHRSDTHRCPTRSCHFVQHSALYCGSFFSNVGVHCTRNERGHNLVAEVLLMACPTAGQWEPRNEFGVWHRVYTNPACI